MGLNIIAFGTSSPELAVSVMSAFKGQADLALGNVVGSNIFNILFIPGISALGVTSNRGAPCRKLDVRGVARGLEPGR